jgi:flagellar biosynthetic protein FlhB
MAEQEDAPDPADRSEAATPRRIERAREQGQVALSREATGFAALLFGSIAAMVALPTLGLDLLKAMRASLEGAHELGIAEAGAVVATLAAWLVAPVAAAVAIGAVAATLLQTRGTVSARPLAPRLEKLSPMAGLKRLFGTEGLAEFVRSLLKLALVGAVLWHAIGDPAALKETLHGNAGETLGTAWAYVLRLTAAALIAFAGIAVLDLLWTRFNHLRTLRMSRQELREEQKDSEGDPHIKARRRQLRESRARNRMMAEVPRAAVVVTNPTHYAIALAYAGGEAAPKVVAKGVDELAARIRAAAEQAAVPLVSNPPLARALHKLELGAEIPAQHYQAVAEIIAFVWKRRGAAQLASDRNGRRA